MRNNRLIIFLAIISLTACKSRKFNNSLPSVSDLTRGLIAYYPFNSNTNDESGNGNNGTLINGSSLTSDKSGKSLSALNCEGNGQGMIVANSKKIRFESDMTVSFNVMSRTINRSSILSMVEHETGKGNSFLIGVPLPGNNNLIYSVVNNEVGCAAFQKSYEVSNIDGGIRLEPDEWYNVICSYSKGEMKLFINGALISSRASKNQMMNFCPNAQLLIGTWWNGDPSAALNGKIDEIRLYNRQLNADEIQSLAKALDTRI